MRSSSVASFATLRGNRKLRANPRATRSSSPFSPTPGTVSVKITGHLRASVRETLITLGLALGAALDALPFALPCAASLAYPLAHSANDLGLETGRKLHTVGEEAKTNENQHFLQICGFSET